VLKYIIVLGAWWYRRRHGLVGDNDNVVEQNELNEFVNAQLEVANNNENDGMDNIGL
jgi:hypothetical protein